MSKIIAALGSILLATVVASPAAASNRLSYGASAGCYYRTTADSGADWMMRIRRIVVQPPVLPPISKQQVVGWRFVVQRQFDFEPWAPIYRSPIQKGMSYADQPASFTPMGVRVAISDARRGDRGVVYRVILKAFWYNPNGSRQRTAHHRFVEYNEYRDGVFVWTEAYSCTFAWTSG